MPESVGALTRAVARGDPEAFARFYQAWFDRAYAKARRLTRRDEAFCLDVVQDVMMKVIRSMRPLEGEEALAAWMSRVVHTTALDHLRRELRRSRRESACPRPESAPQADPLEREERMAWLEAELGALDEAERGLLRRRFEEGGTLRGAGEGAGLGVNAAHGRLRRLLGRLRVRAREHFDAAV